MKGEKKICGACGKNFTQTSHNHKFCSKECRERKQYVSIRMSAESKNYRRIWASVRLKEIRYARTVAQRLPSDAGFEDFVKLLGEKVGMGEGPSSPEVIGIVRILHDMTKGTLADTED